MKDRILMLHLSVFAASGLCGCGANSPVTAPQPSFSKPHASPIAGTWYPGDAAALKTMIDGFLAKADVPSTLPAPRAIAFVVPHAGYAYSGPTAAYAYKVIAQRKPKRVIVMGPSHYVPFQGVSIGDYDCFQTPLGPAPIDLEAVAKLRKCPLVRTIPEADAREHSVDIQMPFLLRTLPENSFKIVPIVVGRLDKGDFDTLAAALQDILDKDTVVIASSDFTHYGEDFGFAPFGLNKDTRAKIEKLDMGAVEAIKKRSHEAFLQYVEDTGATICGYCPIALMLSVLPPDAHPTLLRYAVSGDAENNYVHSVSYTAMAITSESGHWPASKQENEERKFPMSQDPSEKMRGAALATDVDLTLTPEEQTTLLHIARDTVEMYVRDHKRPDLKGGKYEITAKMSAPCGAFVTLQKHGELRGCIGHIVGRVPMNECVAENAVNAAVNDTRFDPVRPDELKDIDIEISVLSPLKKVNSPKDIVIGKHGIVMKQGYAQAVYLPQVAPEQGWNLEQTLTSLSHKAGLPGDAWKQPGTEFQVFTAQVFGEK